MKNFNKELLILGPPKTGTTSLWYSLRHPDIASCKIKEPLHDRHNIKARTLINIQNYIDVFKNPEYKKYLFDCTPNLYNTNWFGNFLMEIYKNFKSVKVIYVFRNPYDRLYSHYKMLSLSLIHN